MSWLFSQALVEEYLGGISLDGEQSAPSSGSLTQLAYCAPDKMTAFSRLSRFGMTYKPLTADRGEELLTSYLAAFPVRTSQRQEKAQESTESNQECGEKWRGSFTKYDLDSCSWKTHQCSLLGDLDEFSGIWPRWGLMRNGECWEQQPLEHRIKGTGFGLWPTPTVCGNYNRKGASATSVDGLATTVIKRMWPTPLASDGTKCSSDSLTRAVRPDMKKSFRSKASQTWATPTATDYKGSPSLAHVNERSEMYSRGVRLPEQIALRTQQEVGGALNPTWVEWLMGWPLGWTDLKPLEMDKSHCVQPKHGDC